MLRYAEKREAYINPIIKIPGGANGGGWGGKDCCDGDPQNLGFQGAAVGS
jgi:hypothetical protein